MSGPSMLHTFKEQTVPVTEHKKTYVVTAENDVVYGGLSVEKRDSITGSTPQGNADFSGITFEIINDSRNPVIVGDKSIGHGEVALTLTTDREGKASTAADALPYGAYSLHEASTNESMLNTAPDQPVEVTENGKVYPFFMDNEVVRGGVLIEKPDGECSMSEYAGRSSFPSCVVFTHKGQGQDLKGFVLENPPPLKKWTKLLLLPAASFRKVYKKASAFVRLPFYLFTEIQTPSPAFSHLTLR